MVLPESRYVRRLLFGLAALCIVLLGVLELVLLPRTGSRVENIKGVGAGVVSNLLTTLIVFLVAAGVILWLIPPQPLHEHVQVVTGHDRSSAIEAARRDSTIWWFAGGLGRYNRAVLLPELARRSRNTNTSHSVIILTLDPDSPDVCATYAQLRRSRRSGKNQTWTESSVRNEVMATILAAARWHEREPLLEVVVGLRPICSLTRLEVSESCVIQTSEDPMESALIFPKSGPFYSLLREDFRLEHAQSRSVKLLPCPEAPEPEELRRWFISIGIDCAKALSPDDLKEIEAWSESDRNPYV